MGTGVEKKAMKAERLEDVSALARLELPESMMKDAFVALTVAILQEMFLSSDTKYFIFQGMMDNLRDSKRYTEAELEKFRTAMNVVIKQFSTYNDFMG